MEAGSGSDSAPSTVPSTPLPSLGGAAAQREGRFSSPGAADFGPTVPRLRRGPRLFRSDCRWRERTPRESGRLAPALRSSSGLRALSAQRPLVGSMDRRAGPWAPPPKGDSGLADAAEHPSHSLIGFQSWPWDLPPWATSLCSSGAEVTHTGTSQLHYFLQEPPATRATGLQTLLMSVRELRLRDTEEAWSEKASPKSESLGLDPEPWEVRRCLKA
jgi:hypothetical protein